MDLEILSAAGPARPKVLIVPTAAARQNPSKAAANGVAYFDGLGAEAEALMVLDSEGADDTGLVSRIGWADVIYLTGGDPAHLLEVLRGSRMLEAVKRAVREGAVLAGSSAGAMVLGSWMRYRRRSAGARAAGRPRQCSLITKGAARTRSPPSLRRLRTQRAQVLGVDAGSGCLGGRDGWRVVGKGSVVLYSLGTWRRFQSGESVPVDIWLSL